MMRSMMSAVTGLKAQQTAMDVIGNNVANVNTSGFKASTTQFSDLFYQTLKGGTPNTNPSQVGYGTQVSDVSKDMTSAGGSITDNPWDLYADGEGYFVISTSNGSDDSGSTGSTGGTTTEVTGGTDTATPSYYTRVGHFTFNPDGYLVDSTGNYVMGTTADEGSDSDGYESSLEAICIPNMTFQPNDSSSASLLIEPPGTDGDGTTSVSYGDLGDITFNADGSISATYNGETGTITDGTNPIKVAMANFVNEGGLTQVGNNDYEVTQSSGPANFTTAGDGNTTQIYSNELEMSNVDLSTEFTNMIVTQRGFQANSRVITTSDTLLQELLNLKQS